jgi:hypothetical protein
LQKEEWNRVRALRAATNAEHFSNSEVLYGYMSRVPTVRSISSRKLSPEMQLYLYETVPCLGLGKTLGLKTAVTDESSCLLRAGK